MDRTDNIQMGVADELRRILKPPRHLLAAMAINGLISLAFFLVSYWLGNYSQQLLPVAAATILLWTLADLSITNSLIFDKQHTARLLKRGANLKQLLVIKNLSIVVISIPTTLLFGIILALLVGRWSEIIYGLVMALALIWGWLGISNAMSAVLPFEMFDFKSLMRNRRKCVGYGLLYCLPWAMLPVYAGLVSLPFVLVGWTRADAAQNHRIVALVVLFGISLLIWQLGLYVVNKYVRRPQTRLSKLLSI